MCLGLNSDSKLRRNWNTWDQNSPGRLQAISLLFLASAFWILTRHGSCQPSVFGGPCCPLNHLPFPPGHRPWTTLTKRSNRTSNHKPSEIQKNSKLLKASWSLWIYWSTPNIYSFDLYCSFIASGPHNEPRKKRPQAQLHAHEELQKRLTSWNSWSFQFPGASIFCNKRNIKCDSAPNDRWSHLDFFQMPAVCATSLVFCVRAPMVFKALSQLHSLTAMFLLQFGS